MSKQPCVYLLASDLNGTICIGVTADLLARLYEHREGSQLSFVKRYAVLKLVRYEFYEDMPTAIAREKQLKRWHRAWKINLIESENPDWHDLAVSLGLPPLDIGLTTVDAETSSA